MSVLGVNLEKNGFRYCILDGTKEDPSIIHFEKVLNNNCTTTGLLVSWYETTFQTLIDKYKPSSIGAKLSLDAKKDCIAPWYYPLGFLHNIAHQNDINICEFVSANFTASKFGLDKTINIYDHIDERFGVFHPKWDKAQKYALISAWMVLV